jgi:hypothetical protein
MALATKKKRGSLSGSDDDIRHCEILSVIEKERRWEGSQS